VSSTRRAHAAAGSPCTDGGGAVRWGSSASHVASRDDFHPVRRPCSTGEFANAPTSTGPSACTASQRWVTPAPSPASTLFVGKSLANLVFVLIVEAILAPVFIVFYNLHVLGNPWLLAIILPLGTWALVVNGTFFAVLGLRTRNRELLLPLLLLPISLPALLEMVQATTGVLTAELDPLQINTWITQLAGYDIVYTIVCLFLFDTVLNAE